MSNSKKDQGVLIRLLFIGAAAAAVAAVVAFGRGKLPLSQEQQAAARAPHYYVEPRTGMCFDGNPDSLAGQRAARWVACSSEVMSHLPPEVRKFAHACGRDESSFVLKIGAFSDPSCP